MRLCAPSLLVFIIINVSAAVCICYYESILPRFIVNTTPPIPVSFTEEERSTSSNSTSINDTEEPLSRMLMPKRRKITESFVLSMDTDRFQKFVDRNDESAVGKVLWVPGVDGFQQENLDQWAKLAAGSKEPAINATLFIRGDITHKSMYRSPHAVGCYLAHWHLLRQLNHRPPELRPDLYFIFEDDALCVPDLLNRTLESASYLPSDWDILYVGGKPFSYFDDYDHKKKKVMKKNTTQQRAADFCSGAYGMGASPLAPGGGRQLSEEQPYWRTKYLTNTYAYVVNPQRLDHILEVLQPRSYTPIDILLADAMKAGKLNAYMTSQKLCLARGFNFQKMD
eukprot:CAMPEP_0119026612 /NCGR_PEP_ID=MMETSP1176-20130426/35771_1 /TAXON_ID=265551 /ORGANISM="Synedropsis recta cf, Strain CCMP1620" /LENGTH=338 /DNA_ID=CAMNT_0006982361 /DNA_START=258 /DNA_END=1271 /DNA_ORIENTATION=+